MFKRPRLSCHYKIVNAALAASLVFLAACGDQTPEETVEEAPFELPTEPSQLTDSYKIQAVWATDPISNPIIDLAFTGGVEPLLAAALRNGGLQLFNVQGDRITESIPLGVTAIATGQAVVLNDAALSLFPGTNQSGDINFYAYAPVLGDPIKLDVIPGAKAAGLCAGPPLDPDAIMQLAYWTQDEPETLLQGHIYQNDGGDPEWALIGTHSSGGATITACTIGAEIKIATQRIGHTMTSLVKHGERFTLALTDTNLFTATNAFGTIKRVDVQNGITVRVPETLTAMAALSNVQFGNYPDGLVVVSGPVDGHHQITLIEPGGLFRKGG